MKKRTRKRASAKARTTSTALVSAAAGATLLDVKSLGASSGFDGANWSSRRGYVYFPTLNTQREVAPSTRLEMIRRGRYLVRNSGYAKRCTRGLAQMVGFLSPRANTLDKDWNTEAEQAFERRAGRPLSFDRGGRFNVYSFQPLITGSRLVDGDFGCVLTESQTGGALIAGYEGHQIGNGLGAVPAYWRDGVFVWGDRALKYRLLDAEDTSKNADVPAQDFILNADYLSIGHSRGVSALHHAINNLLDITEIRSDVKLGIKLGNRIGYYIARQLPQQGGAPKGMGGKVSSQVINAEGDEVLVEQVYKGGKILGLNAGEEIKQLLDQRPHPNSREFLEDLNRDIAWGIGISPDVLWNIAKIGGAAVRYVLADAQVWIDAQQQLLVDQFLSRYWVYFIAKEIKAGRLRQPNDPEWYWKAGWQPPAKLTVDVGRDGKLSIDLHRAGMLTLKRWYGAQGLFEEEEMRQHVREYALKIKLCQEVSAEMGIEIDPAKVFPAAPGSPGQVMEPVEPGFSDPENVQRTLLEIRDSIAELRPAA